MRDTTSNVPCPSGVSLLLQIFKIPSDDEDANQSVSEGMCRPCITPMARIPALCSFRTAVDDHYISKVEYDVGHTAIS